MLEANPRASRTVPFVAKATGVPVAMVAARVMVGATLAELRGRDCCAEPVTGHVSVKEAVLPFNRFPGVDTLLGPEMRSTGEVMGIDATFGLAFAKSQIAAGNRLPVGRDGVPVPGRPGQGAGLEVARQFAALGFELAATSGTAAMLEAEGVAVATVVAKVGERRGRRRRGRWCPAARSSWWSTRLGDGAPGPTATTSAPRRWPTRCPV